MMLTRPLALMLAASAPMIAQAQPGDPAVARVQAYGGALGTVVREAGKLGGKARVERFVPVVVEYYDLGGALALIAGPAWSAASAADRATAIAAFARNSAIQHAANFTAPEFHLMVEPVAKARGADTLVRAHIGAETLVYRLRLGGGRWRIIDVIARGGVSQLAVQKADFAATVAKGGVPALIAKLNEINARPR